jgi:hypothetical protein
MIIINRQDAKTAKTGRQNAVVISSLLATLASWRLKMEVNEHEQ